MGEGMKQKSRKSMRVSDLDTAGQSISAAEAAKEVRSNDLGCPRATTVSAHKAILFLGCDSSRSEPSRLNKQELKFEVKKLNK